MKNCLKLAGCAISLILASPTSMAALLYDQDVTPDILFGDGNINGSFTVDRNNDVELGLRGKLRYNASGDPENTFNSNGDGTYSFAAGVAPGQSSPTAVWSFEWSINSDYTGATSRNLSSLTYLLGIDRDASQTTDFFTFDPINVELADHAIGDNSTGNGNGTVASDAMAYTSLIDANNVAQNSWKPNWFIADFSPTVDGTYNFFLQAQDGENVLARTEMQVIVGNGGAASVPEPASLALMGLGIIGLTISKRRRKF